MRIGVIAPSSVVPATELQAGIQKLESLGHEVWVHPQVKKKHLFFAGSDEQRAEAIMDYAHHPEIDVIWCARGGYGAQRLIPHLEELSHNRGIPNHKLMIGFSDITVLMEYVRRKWQWSALHAPMVANHRFSIFSSPQWKELQSLVERQSKKLSWMSKTFRKIYFPKKISHSDPAMVIGGNLSVWTSLYGTRHQPISKDRFLFFEDISETPSKIDRMVTQLDQAGAFEKIRGILLGEFVYCEDSPPSGLVSITDQKKLKRALKQPKKSELKPIRSRFSHRKIMDEIFKSIGEKHEVPVLGGLPIGHGNKQAPLPLGAQIRLKPNAQLELVEWDWLTKKLG